MNAGEYRKELIKPLLPLRLRCNHVKQCFQDAQRGVDTVGIDRIVHLVPFRVFGGDQRGHREFPVPKATMMGADVTNVVQIRQPRFDDGLLRSNVPFETPLEGKMFVRLNATRPLLTVAFTFTIDNL